MGFVMVNQLNFSTIINCIRGLRIISTETEYGRGDETSFNAFAFHEATNPGLSVRVTQSDCAEYFISIKSVPLPFIFHSVFRSKVHKNK